MWLVEAQGYNQWIAKTHTLNSIEHLQSVHVHSIFHVTSDLHQFKAVFSMFCIHLLTFCQLDEWNGIRNYESTDIDRRTDEQSNYFLFLRYIVFVRFWKYYINPIAHLHQILTSLWKMEKSNYEWTLLKASYRNGKLTIVKLKLDYFDLYFVFWFVANWVLWTMATFVRFTLHFFFTIVRYYTVQSSFKCFSLNHFQWK